MLEEGRIGLVSHIDFIFFWQVWKLLDQGTLSRHAFRFHQGVWWTLFSTSSRNMYCMIAQLSRLISRLKPTFPVFSFLAPLHLQYSSHQISWWLNTPCTLQPHCLCSHVLSTWSDILPSPKHWNSVHCSVGHLLIHIFVLVLWSLPYSMLHDCHSITT